MWTEYFAFMTMAVLLRVSYELNRKGTFGSHSATLLPQTTARGHGEIGITPQQQKWAKRAVKRYAESQEKKWRRWNEAMFEAKQS